MQIPRHSLTSRQEFVSVKLKKNISYIRETFIDNPQEVHCENVIGAVSIPLGLIGPLRISGNFINDNFYVPLATTEGALVASVDRGAKAITLSKGANVHVTRTGVTRGPVFYTGSLKKSLILIEWLRKNFNLLNKTAQKKSKHIKLLKIDTKNINDKVFLRLYFNTDKAMGMNMATIATQEIVDIINMNTGIRCLSLAGNYDIDKKPAWLNFIEGRGIEANAEVIITKEVLDEVLKTTAEKIHETWLAKCMIGSAISGSMGFNCHFANIIAAFFAATGQDLAHVVEGSLGISTVKITAKKDLYFSIYLPALMIGTIGGGNLLKTQNEAKQIIGVDDPLSLAEILAGTVMAGELSLLASLSEGSLTKAHLKLGR